MKTNDKVIDSCSVQLKEAFESSDYAHLGYHGMKPGDCGIIYIPYIPV